MDVRFFCLGECLLPQADITWLIQLGIFARVDAEAGNIYIWPCLLLR